MNAIMEYRQTRTVEITQVLEDCGVPIAEDRIKAMIDDEVSKIANVLSSGLDIGTLSRHIVNASLKNHPDYGWVFVTQKKYYRVSDMLRRM